jgi:hypothetical protein
LIDDAIMSVVQSRWRKVATIALRAEAALEGRGPSVRSRPSDDKQALARDEFLDAIAGRISALVAAGRLEGAGNLSTWRHSEVRLPPDAQ